MHTPDLTATLLAMQQGHTTWQEQWAQAQAAAHSPACALAFLQTRARPTQNGWGRLGGLAVSVKDLFDVTGDVTTAGSCVLIGQAPAQHDAIAVARLKAAGANLIGRTNMSEFAFSGVGVNPHYGTPTNPADPSLARVPGGSSSGAAVSVACGAAWVGLGSDTGGSLRIPAALQGLVGFKSSAQRVPTQGVMPLSETLDTVGAITRSVRDATLVHEVLSAQRVVRSAAPLSAYRLAVVPDVMFEQCEPAVYQAFDAALQALDRAGAQLSTLPLPALHDIARTSSWGSFSAAESYARQHHRLATQGHQYDPRVAARMQRGASMSAQDYLSLHAWRRNWIARVLHTLDGVDAVLSPTVPMLAPPLAEVAPGPERDEAFFKINALLLRNTSVVNLLDGCALSLPCHRPGQLPVGLMVWHGNGHDDVVLNVSEQVAQVLQAAHRT